jgi:hypothetical protein
MQAARNSHGISDNEEGILFYLFGIAISCLLFAIFNGSPQLKPSHPVAIYEQHFATLALLLRRVIGFP